MLTTPTNSPTSAFEAIITPSSEFQGVDDSSRMDLDFTITPPASNGDELNFSFQSTTAGAVFDESKLDALRLTNSGDTLNDLVRTRPEGFPLIIAHQGAQGVQGFPANSGPAIIGALERGAEAVEFDLYAVPTQADPSVKEVVILHPEGFYFYVDRGGMKNDEQVPRSFEELRSIHVDGVQLVPTLREILDQYEAITERTGVRTRLEIELKGPDTAEAVIPLLRKYIEEGVLTYEDFTLCAFCYGDEEMSRLEVARAMDPNVRLCLSIRGGDFAQDAFGSWDEVFHYCRQVGVEWLDVTRRNLTPSIVSMLHAEGFKVSCHHLRSTDELQHAISLGVDSIRADMFCGATPAEYPRLQCYSESAYAALRTSGFYRISDWIWELSREASAHLAGAAGKPHAIKMEGAHAALHTSNSGETALVPCSPDRRPSCAVDVSTFSLNRKYLSDVEVLSVPTPAPLAELLRWSSLTSMVVSHLSVLPSITDARAVEIADALRSAIPQDLNAVIESGDRRLFRNLDVSIQEPELREVSELIRGSFIRLGRLVGMMATCAARPLENPRSDYVVSIQSPLVFSEVFRSAVEEQMVAQSLRSGNRCVPQFCGAEDLKNRFPLAYEHLEKYPFKAPDRVGKSVAWYEGTFGPIHPGHVFIIKRLVDMGFKTVIVGTVPQNPHKRPEDILPFDARVASVKAVLRDQGFRIAASPDEPGVYVTTDERSFDEQRFMAWCRPDHYIAMGPDNFQAYYSEDRPWALLGADSAAMREFTRFRSMYERMLAPKILINDEEYPFHSTDIRLGRSPSLPAVSNIFGDRFSNPVL